MYVSAQGLGERILTFVWVRSPMLLILSGPKVMTNLGPWLMMAAGAWQENAKCSSSIKKKKKKKTQEKECH